MKKKTTNDYLRKHTCRLQDRCTLFQIPSFPKELSAYFDYEAACIYLGWIAFQAVLFALPIGQVVEGEPIANNKRLKYRLNGTLKSS